MDAEAPQTFTIAQVFDQYLNELGISEFPSGKGKWRNNLRWESDLLENRNEENSITADMFTVEKLLELFQEKPFRKEIMWSKDGENILKNAIKHPNRTRLTDIHKQFKTLKMIGRKISRLDKFITKFENLEELVLSANFLCELRCQLLPRCLRVLELAGNQINERLDTLCDGPPPLHHLGLSHNGITSLYKLIQPQCCWDQLLSLDLSFNHLTNLFGVCEQLKGLPKLKNLHLIGNPLYLFAGYRGFVVDYLPSLSFLDEITVAANERHLFKTMKTLQRKLTGEFCIVKLKIDDLKGMIKHEEVEPTEEGHKILVRYHVEMDFLKDCFVFSNTTVQPAVPPNDEGDVCEINVEDGDAILETDSHCSIKSNEFTFNEEELRLSFDNVVVCKNSTNLMAFMSSVIEVRVVRNVITMSGEPPELHVETTLAPSPLPSLEHPTETSLGRHKRPKDAKPLRKESPTPGAKASGMKTSKSKRPPKNENLFEISRTATVCATTSIDLSSMKDGSIAISTQKNLDILETKPVEPVMDTLAQLTVERGKTSKKNARKPSMKTQESTTGPVSRAPGGKGGKNEVKFEDGGVIHENEAEEPRESLSLNFSMSVVQWKTAGEAMEWLGKYGSRYSLVKES